MSKKRRTQRAQKIIDEARSLKKFYRANGCCHAVRLFNEDWDYLIERDEIIERGNRWVLDGDVVVINGASKRGAA